MKYYREIVIVITMALLVLALKLFNVFQNENKWGQPLFLIVLIILSSCFAIKEQRKIDKNHAQQKINYANIDLVKYIFSIMILVLHFRPFLHSSKQLDLIFNNIITRVCVPFFLVVTGYFISTKEKKEANYIKKYIKNLIPQYLIWSALYLPFVVAALFKHLDKVNQYLVSFNLPLSSLLVLGIVLLPLIILIALVYTGIYYHLWYFPALILSLLVLDKWKKKFKVRYLLVISFVLLLFGATETYFGYLPLTLQDLVSYYYKIFFTTRNFLFFGLFYVVLGYFIGSRGTPYSRHCFTKFIISVALLIFEGVFLKSTHRLDSNILLCSLPVVYYLFMSVIYLNGISTKSGLHFRALSKYYYLIHPAVIFFFTSLLARVASSLYGTLFLLLIVIIITHIIAGFIIFLKKRYSKLIV